MRHQGRAALLHHELARLVALVVEQLRPERIVVFGSVASGEIHEWSDLDVAVVMDTQLRPLDRDSLIRDQAKPIVTLDLFVYAPDEWHELTRTRPFIRDEIAANGRVLYERERSGIPLG